MTTTWDYRLVKHTWPPTKLRGEHVEYWIHRAYYDGDPDVPDSIGAGAAGAMGLTVAEVADEMAAMLTALDRPVLDEKDYEMRRKGAL